MSRKAFLNLISIGKGLSLPDLPVFYRLRADRLAQLEEIENSVADFDEFRSDFQLAIDLYTSDYPYQGEMADLHLARLEVEKHLRQAMDRYRRESNHEPVPE